MKYEIKELRAMNSVLSYDLKAGKPRTLATLAESEIRNGIIKKIMSCADEENRLVSEAEFDLEKAEKKMLIRFIEEGGLTVDIEDGALSLLEKLK